MYPQRTMQHPRRRPRGRVRRRPLPPDVKRARFVSYSARRLRWAILLGAAAVLVAALVVSALLSGCGYADRTTVTTGPGGGSVTYPTGGDELVFRIEHGGGLVPVETVFTTMPALSVYGDGRAVSQGPIPEIYPGPALPNLQVSTLSPDAIQELLSAARDAGLFESGVDYGQPGVADGWTTTYTIAADDSVLETSIYFLTAENTSDSALTDAQIERRMRVLDFQMRLGDLPGWFGGDLGPEESYECGALSILIVPADPDRKDPSGIEPRIEDWPLADLATLGEPHATPQGRRAVISGADLETLRPLVQGADMLTLWKSGGAVYSLLFRPLLPDETG